MGLWDNGRTGGAGSEGGKAGYKLKEGRKGKGMYRGDGRARPQEKIIKIRH